IIDESKGERDEMQAALGREQKLSRESGSARARLEEENAALKKAREVADTEIGALRGQIAGALAGHEKTRAEMQALRQQHENEIGKASAEARSYKLRVEQLEYEGEQLKEQLESSVDEKVLREKIDLEWGQKMETIVARMASDHDAATGKLREEI